MYAIEVLHRCDGSITMEFRGELDLSSFTEMSETLDNVASLRRPTYIDLSGVTFIDVLSARELAVHSQLYAHHVTLLDPSWQVRASMEACDLADWVRFADRQKEFLEQVG